MCLPRCFAAGINVTIIHFLYYNYSCVYLSLGKPENNSHSSLRQPFRYLKTVLQGPPEALLAQDKQILQPAFRHSLVSKSWCFTCCDFPATVCEASGKLTEQITNQPQQGSRGIRDMTSAIKGKWLTLNKLWILTIRASPATFLVRPLWAPVLIEDKEMSSPSKVNLHHFKTPSLAKRHDSFLPKPVCVFNDPILSNIEDPIHSNHRIPPTPPNFPIYRWEN